MERTKLCIVVPCYNEEAVLPVTAERLGILLTEMVEAGQVGPESQVVFVDDGSRDGTWRIIAGLCAADPRIQGIKLSRNTGHQNALLAGLMTVRDRCDCCISIDADLQDDIRAIPAFVKEFDGGCEVVYGVRSRRESDTWFKRATARGFYKLMNLLGAEVVAEHADYRLMSRRALDALADFPETNLFLRGMVPLVGMRSGVVRYDRGQRLAGESKYPLGKMLSFAFDGITSFSVKPIRLVWGLGMAICLLAVAAVAYTLFARFFGIYVAGWSSLMVSIWFLGGVQLISVGVIGEYIGKIYKEVKRRPRYIIEETTPDLKKRD